MIRDAAPAGIKGWAWVPVDPGLTVALPGKQNIAVRTVRCYHSVADIGYILGETKRVLRGVSAEHQAALEHLLEKAQQRDILAGQEIGKMKRNGQLTECEEFAPKLAYLCDTTVQVFGACPTCNASGGCHTCPFAMPDISPHGSACELSAEAIKQTDAIFACPNIIVECTFLGTAGMTEVQAQSEAMMRGHISWAQLQPIVLSHPEITFVLVHFSERYTDAQIRSYFASGPPNVVLWLDSGIMKLP